MKRDHRSERSGRKRAARSTPKSSVSASSKSKNQTADEAYRVGPGKPPKEFQFKPGQSGNPRGAKRKTTSVAPDLKALLERALNEQVELGRGERKRTVTKGAAGIRELVDGFARGDRSARRDLIVLAHKLGVDLTQGQSKAIEHALAEVLTVDDQALLDDYFRRYARRYSASGNADGIDCSREGDAEADKDSKNEGGDP
jgi:hypothetical protein